VAGLAQAGTVSGASGPATHLPSGYEREDDGPTYFVYASDHGPALRGAGLDRVEGWLARLVEDAAQPGRGSLARVELADGTRAVLKQMRRGGLLAPLWRDRYVGERRLVDNLRAPLAALARGVPTARPLALLVLAGPPGLRRGWLATEEIVGAEDLSRRIGSGDPPSRDEIDRVVDVVRHMHEAGIDHPDLNLGNLLVRRGSDGVPQAFVVDLDRGRVGSAPVSWRRRVRALRRLERSSVKQFGERPLAGFDLRRRWYAAYARGDDRSGRRLDRARRSNRFWLALHRLGWRTGDGESESTGP
jgi:hypothetical protein